MASISKRLEAKSFDLNTRKPKVLLLGNGLSRAYNADSWDHFLESINVKKDKYPKPDDIEMPMTLKIILLTDNHVGTAMKENKEFFLKGFYDELDKDINAEIGKLFDCGFDYILTTNYTYELEYSVYGDKLTESRLANNLQRYIEVDRAENKYMLHTFNRIEHDGRPVDVWHIHGEARKPDSMIIGSDYYSRLTSRVIDAASKISYEAKDGKDINRVEVRNWVEALIYGDVYALGFGFDYSEQDLWWILSRKANESRLNIGKVFFYEPDNKPENRIKKDLLKVFGVETEGLDMGYGEGLVYKDFYRDAIEDIRRKLT